MPEENITQQASSFVPLSQSNIWNHQLEVYQQEGIDAWQRVPFYVTNNPYIAHALANNIVSFIQDVAQGGKIQTNSPFYVMEIGAGSGRFAFYMLRQLEKFKDELDALGISLTYIMTDVVEKNIRFWRSHPALRKYIDQGMLDFAQFDLIEDQSLSLINSGQMLAESIFSSRLPYPLIVLSNYVFDSLPADIFQLNEEKLQVGLIPSSVKIKGVSEHNASRSFSAMEIPIIYRDISLPYYQVPILDDILLYFLKNQKKGYFLMPVMSLLGIHNLLKISDQNLFMIVSDKGFNTDHQLLTQNEPGLTLHGNAFSLNVDFRAIGKYFEIRGGDFFHQSSFLGLATNAYTLGYSLKQLPRTRKALETYLNVFSPGDLVNLNQHIFQTKLNCSLDTLVSYFNMTHWDPEVFNHHIDLIIGLITQSDPMKISDLINNLPKIVENFYYLPHGMDTLSNLGTVYQTLQDYPKAIEHYEQSIQFFGEKDYKVYNIGLCYYFLEKYDQAGKKFERTIQLNPEDIMAKGWLSQTKERLHSRSNYAE